jgi:hypothetical protein
VTGAAAVSDLCRQLEGDVSFLSRAEWSRPTVTTAEYAREQTILAVGRDFRQHLESLLRADSTADAGPILCTALRSAAETLAPHAQSDPQSVLHTAAVATRQARAGLDTWILNDSLDETRYTDRACHLLLGLFSISVALLDKANAVAEIQAQPEAAVALLRQRCIDITPASLSPLNRFSLTAEIPVWSPKDSALMGEHLSGTPLILLREGLAPSVRARTLRHELTHLILDGSGLHRRSSPQEALMRMLAQKPPCAPLPSPENLLNLVHEELLAEIEAVPPARLARLMSRSGWPDGLAHLATAGTELAAIDRTIGYFIERTDDTTARAELALYRRDWNAMGVRFFAVVSDLLSRPHPAAPLIRSGLHTLPPSRWHELAALSA